MDAGLLEQSKADGNAVDMDERGLCLGLGRGGETQWQARALLQLNLGFRKESEECQLPLFSEAERYLSNRETNSTHQLFPTLEVTLNP